jgi:hypothetical protein
MKKSTGIKKTADMEQETLVSWCLDGEKAGRGIGSAYGIRTRDLVLERDAS